ncbi:MAG: hypothetical protein EA351_11495 [Gemmatimonadales bacterium]|nr:MAG: hypothetical protein EA351_11495 [Gemmatimonadales bacterium]
MTDVQFADEILDRLRERNPRFHPKAYVFLLSALQHVLKDLDQPRHITGAELAGGVRDLAIRKFGPTARSVLEHWGIHRTDDLGEIVFALVEAEVLVAEDGDRPEDFRNLFDFEEEFERNYPWAAGG